MVGLSLLELLESQVFQQPSFLAFSNTRIASKTSSGAVLGLFDFGGKADCSFWADAEKKNIMLWWIMVKIVISWDLVLILFW